MSFNEHSITRWEVTCSHMVICHDDKEGVESLKKKACWGQGKIETDVGGIDHSIH